MLKFRLSSFPVWVPFLIYHLFVLIRKCSCDDESVIIGSLGVVLNYLTIEVVHLSGTGQESMS